MRAAFLEINDWERDYLKQRVSADEVLFAPQRLGPEMIPLLRGFDVISPFIYSRVSSEVLEALPSVKLVATRSTGYDHIDLAACAARGVRVCNVPAYGENTVAEHTFALMLALARKLHQSYVRVMRGDFSLDGLTGFDLKGKTLGVVGAGKIGLHVIKSARGFGMRVVAYDPYRNSFLSELLGFSYMSVDELLAASDIVTLHLPYAENLHHFMDREKFHRMKPGALFINTARGKLVNTEALLEALDSGHLAGAGLDVVEGEEFIEHEEQLLQTDAQNLERLQAVVRTHVLFRHENVIFTPHNAFNSREALQRILDTTVENISSFVEGEPLNMVALPGLAGAKVSAA